MNRTDLLWPVIVVRPHGHSPLGPRVDLARVSHEDLLTYHRNTSIAWHRQQKLGDTGMDLPILTGGIAIVFREALRRMLAKPAPASTGPDGPTAEIVKTEPVLAKDVRPPTPAPAQPRVAPKKPTRHRGFEM